MTGQYDVIEDMAAKSVLKKMPELRKVSASGSRTFTKLQYSWDTAISRGQSEEYHLQ